MKLRFSVVSRDATRRQEAIRAFSKIVEAYGSEITAAPKGTSPDERSLDAIDCKLPDTLHTGSTAVFESGTALYESLLKDRSEIGRRLRVLASITNVSGPK
jgi:hypothetical protein